MLGIPISFQVFLLLFSACGPSDHQARLKFIGEPSFDHLTSFGKLDRLLSTCRQSRHFDVISQITIELCRVAQSRNFRCSIARCRVYYDGKKTRELILTFSDRKYINFMVFSLLCTIAVYSQMWFV